jgi:glycerophosphoryl diester phosphodiesterase
MNLRAPSGRVLRIGHKGAAALAPENTIRSFEKAVELGVDLVEFDVLDLEDGTLVLAHSNDLLEVSHGAARGTVRSRTLAELRQVAPELPTFDDALDWLAQRPDLGIHVDLKWHGYERAAVEAIRRHGVAERTFVSTCLASSLREIAALEPALTLGFSYPFDRHQLSARRVLAPATAATLLGLRRALPYRIGTMLRRASAAVAVLHHSVVSAAVVARCHQIGAAVVAWTIDDPVLLDRVVAAGVDGVVTNDPRIFLGPRLPWRR